ncbi:hypothetical protein GEV33_010136 [Tenebrio molitor]|uniref:Phospholipid scramblase n=1 Tax=Tenebrio molitor TaxID=7067 RepID=A0A8J6HDA3_TENMO|nr:hypothetical protein GEV33_010136 [Tenebrio molitor]
MNTPQAPLNCPPGLEYLAQIDQLLVHQKIELLEVVTGFETNNQYNIKNSLGQQVYFAKEDTDCLTRNCCGPIRPFDMKIFDNFRNEVIHLYRPLACNNCCFPCCLQSIEVSAPPGNLIGVVQQEWSLCIPIFSVKNANYETVLRIEGPFCTISCCGDVDFEVTAIDGETQVGKITKQWSGLVREMFTDSDHFGVTFPIDLDVKMKAVLLGALFLINILICLSYMDSVMRLPQLLLKKYYDMLIVYGACGESAYAAVEAYAARFPANVFLRLVNRARNTGNLVPQTKGVGGVTREARTPQNDEAVLQAFEEDGTLSIRSVAKIDNLVGANLVYDPALNNSTDKYLLSVHWWALKQLGKSKFSAQLSSSETNIPYI